MSIQWFPGHMTKARRQIEEKLNAIDVVFELLDARVPISSANPMMRELTKRKPRIILLNKADLADPMQTEQWLKRWKAEGIDAIPLVSTSGDPGKAIFSKTESVLATLVENWARKGMKSRPFRGLVVGIPNVGKSTLINRLAKRQVVATGDKPGVTKSQTWIRIHDRLELLDTPGVLWPKFDDQRVGFSLAATGAIKDDILPLEEVAFFVLKYFNRFEPQRLQDRFHIPNEQAASMQPLDWWEAIGRKRGCLVSGGVVDNEKVARLILLELRAGKFGRYTLDRADGLIEDDQFSEDFE